MPKSHKVVYATSVRIEAEGEEDATTCGGASCQAQVGTHSSERLAIWPPQALSPLSSLISTGIAGRRIVFPMPENLLT